MWGIRLHINYIFDIPYKACKIINALKEKILWILSSKCQFFSNLLFKCSAKMAKYPHLQKWQNIHIRHMYVYILPHSQKKHFRVKIRLPRRFKKIPIPDYIIHSRKIRKIYLGKNSCHISKSDSHMTMWLAIKMANKAD